MTEPAALLSAAAADLSAAGVASPRVDAELLLAHVLELPRARLRSAAALDDAQVRRFAAAVRRRAAREPLQHIVGTAAFRHLELAVGPGVFVPRPETELLIDLVLPSLGDAQAAGAVPTAVDLCAGSGALALAIADEARGTRVIAVERAPAALEWLRRNAAAHPAAPVEVVAADVADPAWPSELALVGTADVVLSNPPYLPEDLHVSAEVRADPPDALFAGRDGLALVPAVLACAAILLRPGGLFALEHGDDQQPAVQALLAGGGWTDVRGYHDLAGRPRGCTARRRS